MSAKKIADWLAEIADYVERKTEKTPTHLLAVW